MCRLASREDSVCRQRTNLQPYLSISADMSDLCSHDKVAFVDCRTSTGNRELVTVAWSNMESSQPLINSCQGLHESSRGSSSMPECWCGSSASASIEDRELSLWEDIEIH